MPNSAASPGDLKALLRQVSQIRQALAAFQDSCSENSLGENDIKRFVRQTGLLMEELRNAREGVSPIRFGPIGITLGRSDSIAKFFAFSFSNLEKRPLADLAVSPFYGSGIYAIYYHGTGETSYMPLSKTETPIYVGKANPKNPQAETVEEQGIALFSRLKEHAGNIAKTNLPLSDFHYRAAPIQTGMQAAVEDFMIRLFKPLWNKEIKICHGIGKHGDSATTRANKRSPWDTMHPGRQWAAATRADQMERSEIKAKIAEHFRKNPVVRDRDSLFKLLSLG